MEGITMLEETESCVFDRIGPRYIRQRYKPSATFTPERLKADGEVRDRLCGPLSSAVLVILPAEVPVNPLATNEDHFRATRDRSCILALAVVTDSAQMHTASKLYFMYFQQAFPVKVFDEEPDAHRWLIRQLEASGAG